jgi:hypothetical protein
LHGRFDASTFGTSVMQCCSDLFNEVSTSWLKDVDDLSDAVMNMCPDPRLGASDYVSAEDSLLADKDRVTKLLSNAAYPLIPAAAATKE